MKTEHMEWLDAIVDAVEDNQPRLAKLAAMWLWHECSTEEWKEICSEITLQGVVIQVGAHNYPTSFTTC